MSNRSSGSTGNLLDARVSAGNAINAQPTDTNNLIGIAGVGAGLTSNVSVAYSGEFPCKFDNQTAFNDWVVLGSASQCHDIGATEPPGVQNIGRVASVNGGVGTLAIVDLGLPDVTGAASAGNGVVGPCNSFPGPLAYYTAIQTLTCDALLTTDGAGGLSGKSVTLTGANAGFIAFGQGATPTFCPTGAPNCVPANSGAWHGPVTVATAFDTAVPSAPGTAGQALVIDTAPDATHITTKWASVSASVASTKRVCMMVFGAENAGSALIDGDIAPQKEQCQVPYAATLYEIDVVADAGTPNVIVSVRHCTASPCASNYTVTNVLSSALTAITGGGPACAKIGATTGLDGFTTCTATLQNTSIAQGDYIETVSATAGGTAKRFSVSVNATVN